MYQDVKLATAGIVQSHTYCILGGRLTALKYSYQGFGFDPAQALLFATNTWLLEMVVNKLNLLCLD